MPHDVSSILTDQEKELARLARCRDKISGILILGVSTATLIGSFLMPTVGEGSSRILGAPGLTPAIISAVLICLSAVLIIRSLDAPMSLGFTGLGQTEKRMASAFALIVGYIASLYFLPYVVSTFIMMALFQLVFASRKRTLGYILFWCLAYSAVISGSLYYVFGEVFYIPLP